MKENAELKIICFYSITHEWTEIKNLWYCG